MSVPGGQVSVGGEVHSGADQSSLYPIGHYVGAYLDEEDGRRYHEIRLGTEVEEVTDREFQIWAFAHGVPEQLAVDSHWGRSQVIAAASSGLSEAQVNADIDTLITRGLLVEVAPGPDAAIDFAARYQLIPLMLGLGNSTQNPGMYSIGLMNEPVIEVTRPVYTIWEWAHERPNLWYACQVFAEVERLSGATDPDEMNPRRILERFRPAIHGLLSVNAAYLDLAAEAYIDYHPIPG